MNQNFNSILDFDFSKANKNFLLLYSYSLKNPLFTELFPNDKIRISLIKKRIKIWYSLNLKETGLDVNNQNEFSLTLWNVAFPIAEYIIKSKRKICGITGPSGSGKTTLLNLIQFCIEKLQPTIKVLKLHLDDFSLTKNERFKKGLKFRNEPGSHNILSVTKILKCFLQNSTMYSLPVYDGFLDVQGASKSIKGHFAITLIEGWLIGKRDEGYEEISNMLELLIYVDCPLSLCKKRRFERLGKSYLKQYGHSDFKLSDHERWNNFLKLGSKKWAMPIKKVSSLVLKINKDGHINGAKLKI